MRDLRDSAEDSDDIKFLGVKPEKKYGEITQEQATEYKVVHQAVVQCKANAEQKCRNLKMGGGRLVSRIQDSARPVGTMGPVVEEETGTERELPLYTMMDLQDKGSELVATVSRKHRAGIEGSTGKVQGSDCCQFWQ